MLGCVLCSPGCFSLFRAEALMSDNVMAKYATKSTKAAHYLQYDQGKTTHNMILCYHVKNVIMVMCTNVCYDR